MLKKVNLRGITWRKEMALIFARSLVVFWKRNSFAE